MSEWKFLMFLAFFSYLLWYFMRAEAEAAKFFKEKSGSGSGSCAKDLEAEAEAISGKNLQMEAEAEANFFWKKFWKRKRFRNQPLPKHWSEAKDTRHDPSFYVTWLVNMVTWHGHLAWSLGVRDLRRRHRFCQYSTERRLISFSCIPVICRVSLSLPPRRTPNAH